jgi:tRNA pseudouridine55 synthase
MSSRRAVDVVKRMVRPAKCGHAGTLDPLATGVLVVCIGAATRLIPYVQQQRKRYRATFLLGHTSPTDDIEGEVARLEIAAQPERDQIAALLPQFTGTIQQRPPAYSAVKIAGRRAYALARRGERIELDAKPVEVYGLRILRYAFPELELEVECGSGTYIRALGRDLGTALGTGAVMSALVRTVVGRFAIEDAVSPEQITVESLTRHMLPPQSAVAHLPRTRLTGAELREIRHGLPISATRGAAEDAIPTEVAAEDETGRLAAILYAKRPGEWWPRMNFLDAGEGAAGVSGC